MEGAVALWSEVVARLGLAPVGAIEDGLLYRVQGDAVVLELHYRAYRTPPSIRVVVRPLHTEGSFLVAPSGLVPAANRWRTGDAPFDEQVVVVDGGRVLLPRLGRTEREHLARLVGGFGAFVGAIESTLEPAITQRFVDAEEAIATILDLMRITEVLAVDPPVEVLLDRWLQDDGADMVTAAAARRVVELLPAVTESQAETACRLLIEREVDNALSLLAVMPPYACVLAAWFKVGDPLDPRVAVRVIDAWRSGSPRPVARYLAWLLLRQGSDAPTVAARLWETPGLSDDSGFVREFIRAVRRDPPLGALRLLLQIQPRSSSIAKRLAKALACYTSPEVDRRLLEWLSASSTGIRAAAAAALADRVVLDLRVGVSAHDRLDRVRRAAEGSSELVLALLDRVPQHNTDWLVPIRPHGEPDAIALIRRLGRGGANADEALLFWLDRGTLPVRLEAAAALGSAGSTRVLGPLRDRASAWFSDGGVREACRDAIEQIRRRAGGTGNLALAAPAGGELAEPVVIHQHRDGH